MKVGKIYGCSVIWILIYLHSRYTDSDLFYVKNIHVFYTYPFLGLIMVGKRFNKIRE